MLSAYAEGRNLHTLIAQNLTGSTEVSKDDRNLAKVVNFGLLYGMGAKGLRSYALIPTLRYSGAHHWSPAHDGSDSSASRNHPHPHKLLTRSGSAASSLR